MTADLYPPGLLACLRKQELVTFVGAGLSIPSGGLSWGALCRRFLDEVPIELGHESAVREVASILRAAGEDSLAACVEALALQTYDPLMLAQLYQDHVGRNRVIQVLREMCEQMTGPSTSHDLVASFGLKMFVTTNYDDLLERALEKAGQPCTVIVREEDAAYWNSEGTRVIKMHGSLMNPFDPESVVIAREDYEAYADRRPNMDLLVRFLMTTSSVLLLGYSGRDPNFVALHDRVRLALKEHKNRVFLASFDMPRSMQNYWRSYGFQPLILTGTDRKEALDNWLVELKSRL